MNEKFAIPAVGAIIERTENREDYILIQDRLKPSKEGWGYVEIPAGKVREFEDVYSCLRREVWEETSLKINYVEGEENSKVISYDNYEVLSYEPFTCAQNICGDYPVIVQIFICHADEGEMAESIESKNIRWILVEELEELIEDKEFFYPIHRETIKRYIDYKRSCRI